MLDNDVLDCRCLSPHLVGVFVSQVGSASRISPEFVAVSWGVNSWDSYESGGWRCPTSLGQTIADNSGTEHNDKHRILPRWREDELVRANIEAATSNAQHSSNSLHNLSSFCLTMTGLLHVAEQACLPVSVDGPGSKIALKKIKFTVGSVVFSIFRLYACSCQNVCKSSYTVPVAVTDGPFCKGL